MPRVFERPTGFQERPGGTPGGLGPKPPMLIPLSQGGIPGSGYPGGYGLNPAYNAWLRKKAAGDPGAMTHEEAKQAARAGLQGQADASGQFAGLGEKDYLAQGKNLNTLQDMLSGLASGKDSFSAEQLRQGLGSQLSMQSSLAAGAAPQNQAMAARNASMNMGRITSGMAGNTALAGIAERQAAQQALGGILGQRMGLGAQVGLGGRQNAMGGYSSLFDTTDPAKRAQSKSDKAVAAALAAAQIAAMASGKPG